ncbi:DNA invertase Pin-like site-specific DNA recombinase [Arthrobacter sp. UYEF6]
MTTTYVGYARVSSEQQNLSIQLNALIEAGVDPDHIYSEKMSGALKNRPAWDECLKFLRKGDVLVVWKLDRLGRSLKNLMDIIDVLNERGIGFKCLTAPIDTTSPEGVMLYQLLSVFAQYEKSISAQRCAAGRKAARERGQVGGRPTKANDEVLTRIIELKTAGDMSIAEIGEAVGVSRASVYRYLKTQETIAA